MRFLDEIPVENKKVLIRVDYNVPLKGTAITDDTRIAASLPTVSYALDHGAALILCSHLGKAKGAPDPALSLAPAAARLAELLGRPVAMAPDCIGPEVEKMAGALKPGDILMLENLRFHPGETKNDPAFAAALAKLGVVYVNDAFGTAHRAHASVAAVTASFKGACCGGFLLKKEWEFLGQAVSNPKRPFVAVSGGSKVSSKLGILTNLLGKVDKMIIGGAMANTFLAAQGKPTGKSLVEPELFGEARNILETAAARGVEIVLPVDFRVALDAAADIMTAPLGGVFTPDNLPAEAVILDTGPATDALFAKVLAGAATVVWNGPVGVFENPAFAEGSLSLARVMAGLSAVTVVGGGDSIAVIAKTGLAGKFTFISTGGGASLEFLEGKELPAFTALEECARS
ncbi:MAG: phosphoglycerate kinase [Desulfovibrionaceae bacterium]|nr:phosphoglycerate kinase [Desulfovibrionaceae bacterium]MBF0514074.1 phosphoglycerate kinase [Desulfovibrionaceae bacterium]